MNREAREAMEAGSQKLVAAITDEFGELRPISPTAFEIVGCHVRWSLWEGSTRLHTLTDRAERATGFLEPTADLLEMLARMQDLESQRRRTSLHRPPPPLRDRNPRAIMVYVFQIPRD